MERKVESHSTEIAGREYRANKHNPEEQLELLTLIGRLLGGPTGGAIGAFAQGEGDVTDKSVGELMNGMDGDALGRAISSLFAGVEATGIVPLARRVLKHTEIKIVPADGGTPTWQPVNINRDFHDRLFDVLALMRWVLTVNFENFFEQLANAMGVQLAQAQALIASLKERSGG